MHRNGFLAALIAVILLLLSATAARSGEPIDSCVGSDDSESAAPADSQCTISGVEYEDSNADGMRDGAEPTLSGWTIYADFDGNAVRDLGEPYVQSSLDGGYTLVMPYEHALEGFQLRQEQQPGWSCTRPVPDCSYGENPFFDDTDGQDPDLARSGRDFGNHRTVAPPTGSVADSRVSSAGTARLSLAGGCVARARSASVRGRGVANVSYFLDGRKLWTVIAADSKGRFRYRIKATNLRPGVHRVRAQVTFTAASATASRTLTATMQRCQSARPRFAG